MHACVRVCKHRNTNLCTHAHTFIVSCICSMQAYTNISANTYTHTHIYTLTCTHNAHTCTQHTHTHTHTHTHCLPCTNALPLTPTHLASSPSTNHTEPATCGRHPPTSSSEPTEQGEGERPPSAASVCGFPRRAFSTFQ